MNDVIRKMSMLTGIFLLCAGVGAATSNAERMMRMGRWVIQNAEILPGLTAKGSTSIPGGLIEWNFW